MRGGHRSACDVVLRKVAVECEGSSVPGTLEFA